MAPALVVKGHPLTAEESCTVEALMSFLTSYKESRPDDEVAILELYHDDTPEIDEKLLSGWKALRAGVEFTSLLKSQQQKAARFSESTDQFLVVDKIVITNALRNLNISAKLKTRLGTVSMAGKTFRHTGNEPEGLAIGKKAPHIQSNGSAYNGRDLTSQHAKGILNLVGIDRADQLFIEGIDYDPDRVGELTQNVLNKAVTLGESF